RGARVDDDPWSTLDQGRELVRERRAYCFRATLRRQPARRRCARRRVAGGREGLQARRPENLQREPMRADRRAEPAPDDWGLLLQRREPREGRGATPRRASLRAQVPERL